MPRIFAGSDYYVSNTGALVGSDASLDNTTALLAGPLPVLPGVVYNLSRDTRTDGQIGVLEADDTGLLLVREAANLPAIVTGVAAIGALLTTIDADTGAIATDAAAIETLLGTIDADTSALAALINSGAIPVSNASLPLPTGAATATNQSTIIGHIDGLEGAVGAAADAAATSDTGTFSLIGLVKRVLARLFAPRIYAPSVISTSGDNTVIAAPAAGVRIVITGLRIQNNTGTATTLLIKDGAATTVARLRTSSDSTGLSENYWLGDEIRLTAATAFIINLSGANAHGVSVRYYLETAATGLPA